MRKPSTWLLLGTGVLAAALAPPLLAAAGQPLSEFAMALALPLSFLAAGGVAALQQPTHLAVRRLLGVGVLHMTAFALAGIVLLEPAAPGMWLVNLTSWQAFTLGFASYVGLFAVFPDGHYHSAYERLAVRAYVAGAVILPLAMFFSAPSAPSVLETSPPTTTRLPAWTPWLAPLAAGTPAVLAAPLVGVVLFVLRYRRAGSDLRERMRWPLVSAVLGGAALGADVFLGLLPDPVGGVLVVAAIASLPATLVIGMLRHRLLDVDLVIRRSLVYGVLWLAIAALHVGVTAALGLAAGQRASLPVAVAVAIAAASAFAPARRRLERLADRLVYGHRADGYDLIRRFGAGLAETVPLESLGDRIADTVARGLDARWTLVTFSDEPVEEQEAQKPAHIAPLVHAGERLGALIVGPKRSGAYTEADLELLATLARQAALAVRNARLATELSGRLEELAASRQRLVMAEDIERRRIERDLHDGIQQELVAVLAAAELANVQRETGDGALGVTLARLQAMVRHTQAHLRDLVRGIHPAVLSDGGLVAAVEARAGQLPQGVAINAHEAVRRHRYPPEIEGAAYFLTAEALTNAVKHSGADRIAVTLRDDGDALTVDVTDDGVGFDPDAVTGSGLAGLRDRLEALGGTLAVCSSPGAGTRLLARLPVRERRRA